ncbi:hypothetical protein VTK26DRAFT_6141 [Humicola hyalothermophila]
MAVTLWNPCRRVFSLRCTPYTPYTPKLSLRLGLRDTEKENQVQKKKKDDIKIGTKRLSCMRTVSPSHRITRLWVMSKKVITALQIPATMPLGASRRWPAFFSFPFASEIPRTDRTIWSFVWVLLPVDLSGFLLFWSNDLGSLISCRGQDRFFPSCWFLFRTSSLF